MNLGKVRRKADFEKFTVCFFGHVDDYYGEVASAYCAVNLNRLFAGLHIAELPIAVVGWVIVTYGPIIVATLLWGLAKRSSASWLLHFLLLPSFWALLVAGNSLMLSTLNVPDFDDTLGAPIMPALLVMTLTTALYASALVIGRLSALRGQTNGS